MNEINTTFHALAKDAGNRLRAYILSVSSGATGVFFVAFTNSNALVFDTVEKWTLSIALIGFFITVGLCLYELRIDAKRFFAVAKELEKNEEQRNWKKNEEYKKLRFWLIHCSYVTLGISVISTCIYYMTTLYF